MSKATDNFHGMVWTNWRSAPPPRNTIVLCRYEYSEKPFRARTCRHGCCVNAGFGSQNLPAWWTATDDQTSPLEYASAREPEPLI